jgi:hypothetical protein
MYINSCIAIDTRYIHIIPFRVIKSRLKKAQKPPYPRVGRSLSAAKSVRLGFAMPTMVNMKGGAAEAYREGTYLARARSSCRNLIE